jgi:hypothetical protein
MPGAGIGDDQGSASIGPISDKEKGKAVPHIVLSDTEVSSEEDGVPPYRGG